MRQGTAGQDQPVCGEFIFHGNQEFATDTRRIRAMGIRDHPVVAQSPWQDGHVERLIGSIRRESLDHLVVSSEAHLRGILKSYATYYNEVRTHLSLDKDAPNVRRSETVGGIVAIPFSADFITDTLGFEF